MIRDIVRGQNWSFRRNLIVAEGMSQVLRRSDSGSGTQNGALLTPDTAWIFWHFCVNFRMSRRPWQILLSLHVTLCQCANIEPELDNCIAISANCSHIFVFAVTVCMTWLWSWYSLGLRQACQNQKNSKSLSHSIKIWAVLYYRCCYGNHGHKCLRQLVNEVSCSCLRVLAVNYCVQLWSLHASINCLSAEFNLN